MSTVGLTTTVGPLVDAEWLGAHLDDPHVRIVEVDVSAAAYEQGHVPGAILWNAYSDLRHPDYTPIDTAGLGELLGRSGVRPDTTLAFYGYGAHLGYWLLKAHGHERAVILDGPRERWEAVGGWSLDGKQPEATSFPLDAATAGVATRGDVLAHVESGSAALLDVRSREEYDGERFWPSGAPEEHGRAGRLPGAVHLPITELRSDDGYRSVVEMRGALAARRIAPGRRIVIYCTVGNRAAQAWFALTHLLGLEDVDVYYGSWAEWGSDPTTPVELPRP